jgi:hypothetical protein
LPLLEKQENDKAKRYLYYYETGSGCFDENLNVGKGREIYYYVKGQIGSHL